jgi:uncharacterized protein (TIGR02145 family)
MKKNNRIWIYPLTIVGIVLILTIGCKKDKDQVPVVTTSVMSNINQTSASCGGYVTSDGGASVTERGICWSISTTPTIADNKTTDGTGTGSYTSTISSLNPHTIYYLRAYATNSVGTGYGDIISFTTWNCPIIFNTSLSYDSISDIENNVYKTITIGTQTWMAENLRVTKYKDGTDIPLVTNTELVPTTPCYFWFDNDPVTYKDTYGALYNWYTVSTDNLCPIGWHVPSDSEWTTLTNYLGGANSSGGKLKEIGTSHWLSPNTGATNEVGFTAVPGGFRVGSFWSVDSWGDWWSSTEINSDNAVSREMGFNISSIDSIGDGLKSTGLSVRCVKD